MTLVGPAPMAPPDLGEAGKAAIERERESRREAEKTLKAAQAELRKLQAAAQAAEDAARRQRELNAPDAIERRPLPDPLANPPSAIEGGTEQITVPELRFDDLPGVEDPIRSLIDGTN